MPIYQYTAVDPEKSCVVCRKGFEIRRPISRDPLSHCPVCRREVKKLVSSFSMPKVTAPLSVSDAKKAGFTVLEKRDSGVYEKL